MLRAPASSPTEVPCNIHVAITMRFPLSPGKPACIYAHGNNTGQPAPCNIHAAITIVSQRGKPACIYAHSNRRWQQWCCHSTAICNHRFQTTLLLRTHKRIQSSLKPPLHCGMLRSRNRVTPRDRKDTTSRRASWAPAHRLQWSHHARGAVSISWAGSSRTTNRARVCHPWNTRLSQSGLGHANGS